MFNNVVINFFLEKILDVILNVFFLGIKFEVFFYMFESYGIFVFFGFVCLLKGRIYNKVLYCMGKRMEIVESSICFLFFYFNKVEEVDYVFECIEKVL